MAWNNLLRKSHLQSKPTLSQGLASHDDDRQMEVGFQNLRQMEQVSRKLHKEVKRYGDSVSGLHKIEQKMASDLCNSPLCHVNEQVRQTAENYASVVYQLSHATDDFTQLIGKTVVEPMKKLSGEFASIAAALKKRDALLSECLKCQSRLEKADKLERTGANLVKMEQARRAWLSSKEQFDKLNRLLLMELPQFYEKRIDYFQPCLQAFIRTQVDYYGETTRLFTHLVSTNSGTLLLQQDQRAQADLDKKFADLRSLSIVGK